MGGALPAKGAHKFICKKCGKTKYYTMATLAVLGRYDGLCCSCGNKYRTLSTKRIKEIRKNLSDENYMAVAVDGMVERMMPALMLWLEERRHKSKFIYSKHRETPDKAHSDSGQFWGKQLWGGTK